MTSSSGLAGMVEDPSVAEEAPAEGSLQEPDSVRTRVAQSLRANLTLQPLVFLLALVGSVVVARLLGPSLLAVLATITATATTVSVFSSLGLDLSLPKILPELSVRNGRSAASSAFRQLLQLRIAFVLLASVILAGLYYTTVWNPKLLTGFWPIPLIGITALLAAAGSMYRYAGVAAFRNRTLMRIGLAIFVLGPVLTIGAALIWRSPYAIVSASIVQNSLYLALLAKFSSYDLDESGTAREYRHEGHLSLAALFKRYRRYIAMTYSIFVFNRFVYALPVVILVAAIGGAQAEAIGNAALAVTIVQRGWSFADMPLANLRAPLIARLHAEEQIGRLRKAERLMTVLLTTWSCLLAVGLFCFGDLVFRLLYGGAYETGVAWGVLAGSVALLLNVFALGNATLHQTNRFLPEIIGLAGALLIVGGNAIVAPHVLSSATVSFAAVLALVAGRGFFWLFTDLWTDARIYAWETTLIKLRGVAAATASIVLSYALRGVGGTLVAGVIGVISFWGLFRVLGGSGRAARRDLEGLVSGGLKKLVWLV